MEAGDGPGLEPQLIVVHGGLPDATLLYASIGRYHRVYALPGESESAFHDRCLDLAAAMGEAYVTVGGMVEIPESDFPAG